VLQAKECAPTLSPFDVFIFGLVVECIKELGGVSPILLKRVFSHVEYGVKHF